MDIPKGFGWKDIARIQKETKAEEEAWIKKRSYDELKAECKRIKGRCEELYSRKEKYKERIITSRRLLMEIKEGNEC